MLIRCMCTVHEEKIQNFVTLEAYHGGYTVLYNNTFQPVKNKFQVQRVQAET